MLILLYAGLFVNEGRIEQEGLLTYLVYKIQEFIYQVGGLEKSQITQKKSIFKMRNFGKKKETKIAF